MKLLARVAFLTVTVFFILLLTLGFGTKAGNTVYSPTPPPSVGSVTERNEDIAVPSHAGAPDNTGKTGNTGGSDNAGEPDSVGTSGQGSPSPYSDLPFYNRQNADRYEAFKRDNPDLTDETIVTYVNIGIDMPFYSAISIIKDPDRFDALVNKYNKLPDDYEPELVEVSPAYSSPGRGRQYLRPEAKEAFERMCADALDSGLKITAYGTYRSIATQNAIWNREINRGRTVEDVDSLNARGGHSEHNTGLAVDVIVNNYTVEDTGEYEWYRDNAHKYGFIIRYREGMEFITGYKYEPWHLRYLGAELATAVYASGLTYEEYYVRYIEPDR